MKRVSAIAAAAVLLCAVCAQIVCASGPLPQYVYEDAERELPFSLSPAKLRAANSPEKALRLFGDAMDGLTGEEKSDPYVIEGLALLAEECIRYGGGGDPAALRSGLVDVSSASGAEFLRQLRLGINIGSGREDEFDFGRVEVPAGGADYFHIETSFASLRLNMRDAGALNDVSLRQPAVYVEVAAEDPPPVFSTALKFWSVPIAFILILLSILVEPIRKSKATRWAVLGLCLLLYALNFIAAAVSTGPQEAAPANRAIAPPEESGVAVSLAERMTAVLSLPIGDASDRDLTVVDADGNPVPCKYNPVTQMIDARITESGTYSLGLSAVYFTDVRDKSAEMQYAIRILTSRGLMDGADERSFLPDREITRAEFISVIIRLMDLLDRNADSPFPDVLRSDWFYSAAASAYKEGLIAGYDDGTFRGNTPIPKVQMVSIVASALTRMMGYYVPEPNEALAVLEVYQDGGGIAGWAQQGAALATRAGLVPQREDGMFDGDSVMTRGDAAVMLYRLFNVIW